MEFMKRPALAVAGPVHAVPVDAVPTIRALSALAALGQATRLEVFRLLMRCGPGGLAAGAIAEAIGCPQNTLSSHIAILARAGLVLGARNGRSIVYRADIGGVRRLIEFLAQDCCNGHPEICGLLDAAKDPDGGRAPAETPCRCRK